ncbi:MULTISPECIES: aspartyl/asparaginyl beta-hydroxylase domain-containing protein [unclassified Leptolyngbya]|uniref:aspartyl/asparaginyl beta-hydroxylase domain-containing protein n=1 Tax=unclassified Leptolyngbya TaxID=2650499 RepID=UPI0016843D45|nr:MULTISPECIES: aspartyl/asparaginyl beta-hydroxylase domain-containing protein [unclassified Leptolyngbya]MBD1913852.1 aspartyl/asparaginyl beta-hydroxylase domain-containing protein [Leptolyngbya sp. FACHB-8]MBD2157362.1 aspartyl/asparaginyl beta-hydroxylase domain-containing protein [Leptolyngbya sp. FACHB-16]
MEEFNEYHLDPQQFPFLNTLQENWQTIRDEFTFFKNKASEEELRFAHEVMGPKSKTVKTKGTAKYSAFGVLFQGLLIEDYIRVHQIKHPEYDGENVAEKVFQLRERYFPKLSEIIEKTNSTNDNILRNVYYGTFHPGLDVKLHVNYNLHTNRGYLGLIVPEGDIAMKICHDTFYWHEGEFMVLDHSYPHCPHNYTEHERTVLVVDFFKPDKPREDVIRMEQEFVEERMQENPYSLGVFGKNDKAQVEDFVKYGLSHQLEWDKALNT